MWLNRIYIVTSTPAFCGQTGGTGEEGVQPRRSPWKRRTEFGRRKCVADSRTALEEDFHQCSAKFTSAETIENEIKRVVGVGGHSNGGMPLTLSINDVTWALTNKMVCYNEYGHGNVRDYKQDTDADEHHLAACGAAISGRSTGRCHLRHFLSPSTSLLYATDDFSVCANYDSPGENSDQY